MAIIRNAKLKDCKTCARLAKIEELRPGDGKFIPESYFRLFVDKNKLFFVAEENAEVIGFILGEPMKGGLANLGLLAVDIKFRGKEIGKKLVEAFRKRSFELGLNYIFLNAPSFNKKTLRFYKNNGFIQGKEYTHFIEVKKMRTILGPVSN